MSQPRVALVTGVSRPGQIAEAIVRRLHDCGVVVVATGWPPHDSEMPWGGGEVELPVGVRRDDMSDPTVPAQVVDDVMAEHGRLDIVVAAHARSSDVSLADTTAAELDRVWATNVRSVILLAQRFAAVHPHEVGDSSFGRMLWFTSGQHLGPMPGEVPYAVSKGALHQMTATLAASLAPHGVVANCINPGPVDTGYADDATLATVASAFPDRRWGRPGDVADLVEFLVSERGGWIRGQVVNSEGGFAR